MTFSVLVISPAAREDLRAIHQSTEYDIGANPIQ